MLLDILHVTAENTDSTSLSLWKRSSKSWDFGANNFSTNAAGSFVFMWSTTYNQIQKMSEKFLKFKKGQRVQWTM